MPVSLTSLSKALAECHQSIGTGWSVATNSSGESHFTSFGGSHFVICFRNSGADDVVQHPDAMCYSRISVSIYSKEVVSVEIGELSRKIDVPFLVRIRQIFRSNVFTQNPTDMPIESMGGSIEIENWQDGEEWRWG